jgi:hypothetical protein
MSASFPLHHFGHYIAGRIAETEKFRNNQLLKNLHGAGLVDTLEFATGRSNRLAQSSPFFI